MYHKTKQKESYLKKQIMLISNLGLCHHRHRHCNRHQHRHCSSLRCRCLPRRAWCPLPRLPLPRGCCSWKGSGQGWDRYRRYLKI